MISFQPTEPPPTFDERCRQPGLRWVEEHPDAARPRDFWSQFRNDLADAFHDLCAYSAMYTPSGTVDHFVSCREDRRLAYEWSNMRFAQHWINSSKQDVDGLLDPFEVEDDWFEIILPSLELRATDRIPPALRGRAEFTLDRLHLRNDERVRRVRRMYLQQFEDGNLSLDGLRMFAPLIARAIEVVQSLSVSPTTQD